MKRSILFIGFIGMALSSFSQKADLVKFEKERTGISKRSMLVLGAWSVANIAVSGIATNTSNRDMRYFHQMNVMWGGINLAIAGLGYWGAGRENIDNPTLAAVLKHQSKTEKTYLINAGLDVLYVGGGLWMNKASDHQKNPDKFKGYGNSIMLQGGFLLLYDAVNYAIHRKHRKLLNKMELSGAPGSVSLVYRF